MQAKRSVAAQAPRLPSLAMSPTTAQGPKRFYSSAATLAQEAGHGVLLDGRVAKTPGGAPLVTPTATLGALIALEWDAQGAAIVFSSMPLTRLAFTALDLAPAARDRLVQEVGRHVQHDLICHLAEGPERLVARQEAAWSPWRDWAETTLGVSLTPVSGVAGRAQSLQAVRAAEVRAAQEDDFALTALTAAAALFGSGVLAFALCAGVVDADGAFEASRIDEAYQEEMWGVDEEAGRRTAALREEARRLQVWFEAL